MDRRISTDLDGFGIAPREGYPILGRLEGTVVWKTHGNALKCFWVSKFSQHFPKRSYILDHPIDPSIYRFGIGCNKWFDVGIMAARWITLDVNILFERPFMALDTQTNYR